MPIINPILKMLCCCVLCSMERVDYGLRSSSMVRYRTALCDCNYCNVSKALMDGFPML